MSNFPVVRRRTRSDDVVSPGQAAAVMRAVDVKPKTRQGITKAVKAGRIPGFLDPNDGRWWVERSFVDSHRASMHTRAAQRPVENLDDRLGRLEEVVEELVSKVEESMQSADDSTSAAALLERQLSTANAVNTELNAASHAGTKAAAARQKAVAAMSAAINHLQELAGEQADEIEHLRNAITQTTVPDTLPSSGLGSAEE